jgi:hypothetical protein
MAKAAKGKSKTSFERRCRDAERGVHLPTVAELLRLSPFFNNDIESDIQTFAERMLMAIESGAETQAVRDALKALSAAPWQEVVEAAIPVFQEIPEHVMTRSRAADIALRLKIYSAFLGNEGVIGEIAHLCLQRSMLNRNALAQIDLVRASIGWQSCLAMRRSGYSFIHLASPQFVHSKGDDIFKVIGEHWQKSKATQPDLETDNALATVPGAAAGTTPTKELVVVSAIGNSGMTHAREVETEFKPLVQKPLPLRQTSQAAKVRQRLAAEFPHAIQVLDTLLGELAAGPYLRLRPSVLLGGPGIGKTRFCQRLMSELSVPHAVFSCGGVADSSLAGTARRWSTGEPSLPLSLVRQHKVANPCIVLDEMDKVGTSRHNGNLHDSLLGLLEQQSSSRWFDPYLQAPVDLSAVLWLGTANSLDGWTGPLRDRVRILKYPSPGPEHLASLSAALLEQIAAERGLGARWMSPLTGQELDALRAVWPGGSVRKLRRYIEGVLEARQKESVRQ